MKRKFSKILGVGLTLSLLISLLLTAAPVSADVSQPTVSLDVEEISASEEYTIVFTVGEDLADTETITVRFEEDTDVGNFDGAIPADWSDAADYAVGALVVPETGGDVGFTYECITAGTAVTEPIWSNWAFGDVIPDGTGTSEWTVFTGVIISTNSGMGGIAMDKEGITWDNIAVDTDDLTLEITNFLKPISRTATVELVIGGVINPTDPGTYTLEVQTEAEEDYVESEEFDIDAPTVGGFVYVYNASNVLLETFGGDQALNSANIGADLDGEDYTYKIGPGTYELGNTITISGEGLTLESAEGAEDTIIEVGEEGFLVTGDDVTIDGFTMKKAKGDFIIKVTGEDATIVNNILDSKDDEYPDGIYLYGAVGATVSGNELDINSTMCVRLSEDCTLSDNEFGAGINVAESIEIDITDNEIIGSEFHGIVFEAGVSSKITIEGNIISETIDGDGAGICLLGSGAGAELNKLKILNNEITDSEEVGILIKSNATWGTGNVIKFNTITGDDDGIICDGDVTDGVDIDATFNWWGTTDKDDIEEIVSENVSFEPFLIGTAEDTTDGGKAVTNASSLDAKSACGVKVSGVDDGDDEELKDADVISALKYAANPADDINDAIAFYDVYIILEDGIKLEDVSAKIKFYDGAIDEGSVAHFWGGDFWAECSDQEARDGVVYVTLTEDTVPSFDEMEDTPFVVVAGEAEEALAAPLLSVPEAGADDVSLTPTFAWEASTDADGYYFVFADNADMVFPLVSMTGDYGRLTATAHAYTTELPYSTPYYWKVKAVSGTEEGGDLEESAWASSVFITMDEPKEEVPPVVVEEAPPVVIKPIVEVITPAAEVITPAWIYVIIAVGAVLVIALLVLIIRTRRVA